MEPRKDPRNFHRCYFCDDGSQSLLYNLLQHNGQHSRKLRDHSNVFTCRSNVSKIYKCKNCDFETNLKVSLTHHLNINHKNHTNEYQFRNVLRQCGFCDFQTYSMLFLLKHCLKCDKRDDLGTDEVYDKVVNWLECGQCSYITKYKRYLREHAMRMHSINFTLLYCKKCSFKTKNKLYFRQHVWKHGVKIRTDPGNDVWHHCDKCKFKSKLKTHLKRHIAKIHTTDVWYYCDKCEHKTKLKADLKQHMAHIHTDSVNIMLYHCDKCEYKAKKRSNLKIHIADIHTDSANVVWYYCDKCKYKTKRKADLKKHITRLHTDVVNIVWYHCDKCKYITKRTTDLKRHIATKHTDAANIV